MDVSPDDLKQLQPTQEDQRKLHAEINQLINQTVLLNIAAIAFYGATASAMASKFIDNNTDSLTALHLSLIISVVVDIILVAMYYTGFSYLRTMKFLAAYLIVTKTSVWEHHYLYFLSKSETNDVIFYIDSRSLLFKALIACNTIMPFVFCLFCYTQKPFQPATYHLISLLLLIFLISIITIIRLEKATSEISSKTTRNVYINEWENVIGDGYKFENTTRKYNPQKPPETTHQHNASSS